MTPHVEKWISYRDIRAGSYEYRSRTRYKAVANALLTLGLHNGHVLRDIGAGSCQFGMYLRERGWRGDYIPVDAVIDGTDLDTYSVLPAHFITCIEVVEHLRDPHRLIADLLRHARYGVVITTPNPDAVDVVGCDPTHVSAVSAASLIKQHGMIVSAHSWFGTPADTLLAWKRTHNRHPHLPIYNHI